MGPTRVDTPTGTSRLGPTKPRVMSVDLHTHYTLDDVYSFPKLYDIRRCVYKSTTHSVTDVGTSLHVKYF